MRIVVINTAAESGGALTILKDFYQYVKENDVSNEWVFILSDYYIEETDNITVKVLENSKKKINRLRFDNHDGYLLINNYNPDVVFSMQNTTISNLTAPLVLYLHQSIPFQNIKKYSFFKKEEYKYAILQYLLGANIKYGLRRADKIIVQTNWMKEAILEQTNTKSEVIEVITPTIKVDKSKINNIKTKNNSFFYPSGSASYKNNNLVELSCNYIDKNYRDLHYRVDITVDEKFTNKHIHSLGAIPREDVFKKMRSNVLIFPSYIETFGLPLAEGRALDSMILASDTPFSREVLEGYKNAYFFNPFDEVELAHLMIKSIKGELSRDIQLSASSNSKNSWEDVYDILSRYG